MKVKKNSCDCGDSVVVDKLNLGRFDQCVDYSPNDMTAEYSLEPESSIFYCHPNADTIKRIVDTSDGMVTIPSVCIGVACDGGRVCDQNVVDSLLVNIELKIFKMIADLIKASGQTFKISIESLKIAVRKIQFFNDDKSSGCYGWVDVSVALFVQNAGEDK